MSELWTSEAPKVDGFYWWKCEPEYKPEVVQIYNGIVLVTGSAAKFPKNHFTFQRWGPMVPEAGQLTAMTELARQSLVMLMEAYSEDVYSAGWHIGLEFMLWYRIGMPVDLSRIGDLDADEFEIAMASQATNGWVVYGDEDEDPKWIPMLEWEAILAKRKEVNSE